MHENNNVKVLLEANQKVGRYISGMDVNKRYENAKKIFRPL
jgi:hypothetical protein